MLHDVMVGEPLRQARRRMSRSHVSASRKCHPPESRIAAAGYPREHVDMDEPSENSNRPRGLLDYWTALCAVLLVVIVVYAVFKAS